MRTKKEHRALPHCFLNSSQSRHSNVGTAKTMNGLKSGRPGLRGWGSDSGMVADSAAWSTSFSLRLCSNRGKEVPSSSMLRSPGTDPAEGDWLSPGNMGFLKSRSHAWTMEDKTCHQSGSRPLCNDLGCTSPGGTKQEEVPGKTKPRITSQRQNNGVRTSSLTLSFSGGETRDVWKIPRLPAALWTVTQEGKCPSPCCSF